MPPAPIGATTSYAPRRAPGVGDTELLRRRRDYTEVGRLGKVRLHPLCVTQASEWNPGILQFGCVNAPTTPSNLQIGLGTQLPRSIRRRRRQRSIARTPASPSNRYDRPAGVSRLGTARCAPRFFNEHFCYSVTLRVQSWRCEMMCSPSSRLAISCIVQCPHITA
jgi:hypothetical protein